MVRRVRHPGMERATGPQVRVPGILAMARTFRDLGLAGAVQIWAIARAADDADDLRRQVERVPSTAEYVRRMHGDPYDSQMWRDTVVLHAIDAVLGTYGVEPLGPVDQRRGPPFEYLNAGDTYATTLVYCRDDDRLIISCMGGIVERHDKRGEW